MTITVETMKQVLDAFNRHDLDAIMEFFSDDCSLDFPRGPESWGQASLVKHKCEMPLQVALKVFLMSTMVKTVTGFPQMETWEYQNGHSLELQLLG